MMVAREALQDRSCSCCLRKIEKGERTAAWLEGGGAGWIRLCCDCIYEGYRIFDYATYDFELEKLEREEEATRPPTPREMVEGKEG